MGKILRSYVFWTYPRGSFHYDVMVTLILVFIFLSPRVIDYRDRPRDVVPVAAEALVKTDGADELIFEIEAGQIEDAAGDAELEEQLLERVQAISGNVRLERYRAQRDAGGRVTEYRVWAHR